MKTYISFGAVEEIWIEDVNGELFIKTKSVGMYGNTELNKYLIKSETKDKGNFYIFYYGEGKSSTK